MDMARIPPWDALPYFAVPNETFLNAPGGGTQIVAYNPLRAYLWLSSGGGAAFSISLKPGITSNEGIVVTTADETILLTYETHGPLVNQAWYLGAAGAANLTVITVDLLRKIGDNQDPLRGLRHTGPAAQPPRISSAPGVDGRGGLWGYWKRLVAQFGPKG